MIAQAFPGVLIIVDRLLYGGGFSAGRDLYCCSVQLEGIYSKAPREICDNVPPQQVT